MISAIVGPNAATAQEADASHPYLAREFYASLGIFFPERKVELRVDGTTPGINTNIDVSKRFRTGGSEQEASYEFGWRFGEKWLFRGQYFAVDSVSGAVLDEDVEWGDYTFNQGTNIVGGSEMRISRLFFGRRWRAQQDEEFGIGAGLHLLEIDAFIRGQAFINGQDAGIRQEAVGTKGPLPNIGAWYMYAFNATWAFNARFDWLSAAVGKYDGKIINASAGINVAFSQHFGAGLSYNYFELDIGIDDNRWRGRANNRFNGAYVHLSAYW